MNSYIQYLRATKSGDPWDVRFFEAKYISDRLQSIDRAAIQLQTEHPGELTDATSPAYVHDTYGTSYADARRHTDAMFEVFDTFVTLPDETPVEFADKKDRICQTACAIGAHCDINDPDAEMDYTISMGMLLIENGKEVIAGTGSMKTTLGDLRDTLRLHI